MILIDNYRFNYIITIHNKENLIRDVLTSVINCMGKNSYIYAVLDGCTDNTEKIMDSVANQMNIFIHKLYAPDVHEIRSINIGLKVASQEDPGFNIILQDDVILRDNNFEDKIKLFYEIIGYENVGMLSFRHGTNLIINEIQKEILECDLIASEFSSGKYLDILKEGQFAKRVVAVRSPECISTYTVKKVGLMDEDLAPYTYDNHDYSLRCIKNNLSNFILSIKFESEEKWGGMRENPHPEAFKIMQRNRRILYKKHNKFIKKIDIINYMNCQYENNEILKYTSVPFRYNKFNYLFDYLRWCKAYFKSLLLKKS